MNFEIHAAFIMDHSMRSDGKKRCKSNKNNNENHGQGFTFERNLLYLIRLLDVREYFRISKHTKNWWCNK